MRRLCMCDMQGKLNFNCSQGSMLFNSTNILVSADVVYSLG